MAQFLALAEMVSVRSAMGSVIIPINVYIAVEEAQARMGSVLSAMVRANQRQRHVMYVMGVGSVRVVMVA